MEDVGAIFPYAVLLDREAPFHISSLESGIYRVRAFHVGQYRFSHTGPACISFSEVWSGSEGDRFVKLTDGITSCMRTGWCLSLLISAGSIPWEGRFRSRPSGVCEGCGEGGLLFIDSIYEQKRIMVKNLPALLGTGFGQDRHLRLQHHGQRPYLRSAGYGSIISRYEKEGRYGG